MCPQTLRSSAPGAARPSPSRHDRQRLFEVVLALFLRPVEALLLDLERLKTRKMSLAAQPGSVDRLVNPLRRTSDLRQGDKASALTGTPAAQGLLRKCRWACERAANAQDHTRGVHGIPACGQSCVSE